MHLVGYLKTYHDLDSKASNEFSENIMNIELMEILTRIFSIYVQSFLLFFCFNFCKYILCQIHERRKKNNDLSIHFPNEHYFVFLKNKNIEKITNGD